MEVTASAAARGDDMAMESIGHRTGGPQQTAIPRIDPDLCDLCGRCVELCPSDAASIVPASTASGGAPARVVIDQATCTYCTDCEAACPRDAICCSFEIVASWQQERVRGET